MGTADIAIESLLALAEKHSIVGLFCGEDKPVGRKQIVTPPAIKTEALKKEIAVFQPRSLKTKQIHALIEQLAPDLIVVVAYGKLLPKSLLSLPKYGAINAHASLLPAYRGASPVQHAIINRESQTGVTIMRIDEGLDTGDIICQREIALTDNSDAAEVFTIVESVAATLLLEVVEKLTNSEVKYTKQNDAIASFAPIIEKTDGEFDFTCDANHIVGLVKGLCLWPGAYFTISGRKTKVYMASYSDATATPGQVLSLNPLTIAAVGGSVILEQLMPESRNRMTGTAYAAGLRLAVGDILPQKGDVVD